MKIGNLIIISGPSGVGKSTLCHKVIRRIENIVYSISYTTRPIRKNEKHGKDYFFISEDRFYKMLKSENFLEYAKVHDAYYGTPKRFVLNNLRKGADVLFDIDVQGGMQIFKKYNKSILIFIAPPSIKALYDRLFKRQLDSIATIKKRINTAKWELKFAKKYKYLIINDDLETAVNKLKSIITAERCKIW